MNSTGRTVLPFVFGVLLIGGAIAVMAWKLDASDLDWQGLLCIGAAGVALSFPWIWEGSLYKHYYDEDFISAAFVSSALLGAYLVYRILRRQRNRGSAVVLFCVLLGRWYFDMFYSFMSKSFFFTLGGALLLLLAFFYRRWNRIDTAKIPRGDDND
jgi:hypothetical protein